MNEMTFVKYLGSFCAAMLVLMLGAWAAEGLYHVGGSGHGGHGDDHGEIKAAYIIEVEDDGGAEEEEVVIDYDALIAAADISKGEGVFKKCSACHSIEADKHGTGPSLYGIVGRDIAAVGDFGYSGTLEGIDGDWNAENLFGFLAAPKKWAPGTSMGFGGLKKESDIANLVAWLDSLDD